MTNFFGNCNHLINWDQVIKEIESNEPAYVGPRHREGDPVEGVDEVVGNLRKAGYRARTDGGNAGWDMYIAGVNFDDRVVKKFSEFVGLDGYTNAWIARVLPGDMAPWHWDITDDEETLSKANPIRYHCHIQPSINGHLLVVENDFFYNTKQGDVFKWPNRKSWHCAANCSYVPFYIFNFWH